MVFPSYHDSLGDGWLWGGLQKLFLWVGFPSGAGITQSRDLDVNVPLEFLGHALFATLSHDEAKEPSSGEG